jgi:hypothetical protein
MCYLFTLRPKDVRKKFCSQHILNPQPSVRDIINKFVGRAIAHAICRRLPTARARVRSLIRSCWICGGQGDTGPGFQWVLRFPLPILIPLNAPSFRAGTIDQLWVVAHLSSGFSLIPTREIKKDQHALLGNYWRRHGDQILICCSIRPSMTNIF